MRMGLVLGVLLATAAPALASDSIDVHLVEMLRFEGGGGDAPPSLRSGVATGLYKFAGFVVPLAAALTLDTSTPKSMSLDEKQGTANLLFAFGGGSIALGLVVSDDPFAKRAGLMFQDVGLSSFLGGVGLALAHLLGSDLGGIAWAVLMGGGAASFGLGQLLLPVDAVATPGPPGPAAPARPESASP